MGIVCSNCIHDDVKCAPTGDSFHEPLVASDRDAGAAGSLAELEAHNAALARQLAESEAEVRALRAQAEEEDRSPETKIGGGGAAASLSTDRRLRLDDAERQRATDRELMIKALRVELEQARKALADSMAVIDGGALSLLVPGGGEQKDEAPDTALAGDVDSVPHHVASDATDTLDHGTGTTTTMEGRHYNKEICKSMWGELSEREGAGEEDGVKNFDDLVHLWYRNLEEYAVTKFQTGTGGVASGEIPFAVQFCSSGWLPKVKPPQLKALRDHFCAIDMSMPKGQRLVITEQELYASISSDKGRKDLRDKTLKTLGFDRVRFICTSDQRRTALCCVVVCALVS